MRSLFYITLKTQINYNLLFDIVLLINKTL